jgi:hypothetical protein
VNVGQYSDSGHEILEALLCIEQVASNRPVS